MPNPWIILGVVVAFVVAVAGAYLKGHSDGAASENLKWTAAVEQQKDEAAQLKAQLTDKVLKLERDNAALAAQKEKEDAQHRQALDKAYDSARAAAAHAGGLRDPGARRGGSGSCPGGASAAAPGSPGSSAPAGGVLSDEAQQFLFDFAREADQLNLDFERVRGDATQCRALIKEAAE